MNSRDMGIAVFCGLMSILLIIAAATKCIVEGTTATAYANTTVSVLLAVAAGLYTYSAVKK